MKKNLFALLFSTLFFAFPFISNAQSAADSVYLVRIGAFVNAQHEDFDNIREHGFVYAEKQPNNYQLISMGGFSKKSAADAALAKVNKAFPDAFVQSLDVSKSEEMQVVQIATLSPGKAVNWADFYKAGKNLYAQQDDDQLKIFVGGEDVKEVLAAAKNAGFAGAFPRSVKKNLLHILSDFETGKVKMPEESPKPETPAAPKSIEQPEQKKTEPAPAPIEKSETAASIRANIKRTAALELQKILKSEGAYAGSLDGYYGASTEKGFENFIASNRQWMKYELLKPNWAPRLVFVSDDPLQVAINQLSDKPETSLATLEKSKSALAKAYRAYWSFSNKGASKEVNDWMNAAIKETFGTDKNAPFDITATYAYTDYNQLIQHLAYIQSKNRGIAVPCWFFSKNPAEAQKAFGQNDAYTFQHCDHFVEIEEVQMLATIASDISAGYDREKVEKAANERAKLFLMPAALNAEEEKKIQDWNETLWKSLDGWAMTDPMHKDLVTTLKAAYYQSQVRIEEYFIDKNIRSENAKFLALTTLKNIVAPYLERFI